MKSFRDFAAAAAVASCVAGLSYPAQALDSTVCSVGGDFTDIQTAINDAGTAAGDTITLCAETFTLAATVLVNKSVALAGSGTGSTFVEGAGLVLFRVTSDDVTVEDMTLRDSSQGLRLELAAGTIDNTRVRRVHFVDNSSRGIELHNATTVTNMVVEHSLFRGNGHGIRMASSSTVDGLTVTDSEFDDQSIGIYQANDGGSSTLNNLLVTGSTFTDHSDTAIFAEEIRNALIERNTFTDNRRDFTIFKFYSAAGPDVEDVTFRNNTSTDSSQSSVLIFACTGSPCTAASGIGGGGITIEGNTINTDVGVMALNFGKMDIRLSPTFAHAPIRIVENSVNFTGTFVGGAGATAAHAIKLRGNMNGSLVAGNTLDGGGVGDIGGAPPTSGIFLQSVDASFGSLGAGDVLTINACNRISGFVNGISVFDGVAGAFGGLPAGAVVNANGNDIAGNASFGLNNGAVAASETVDATGNFWGASDGPAGEGPGGGDAVSANTDFADFLPASCILNLEDDFLLYDVRISRSADRFEKRTVGLRDQFDGEEDPQRAFTVKRPKRLGNPTEKNGKPIVDEETHLMGYSVKRAKGVEKHQRLSRVRVVNNQFGEIYLDTKEPNLLLVPSLKDLENAIPDEVVPEQFPVDHFKCYPAKVTRRTPKFETREVTVDDQFIEPSLLKVRGPEQLCNPVEKVIDEDDVTKITQPEIHLLCYRVTLLRRTDDDDDDDYDYDYDDDDDDGGSAAGVRVKGVNVNNQFGALMLDTRSVKQLCVPSTKDLSEAVPVGGGDDDDDDDD